MTRKLWMVLALAAGIFVLMHLLGTAVASWPYIMNAMLTSGVVIGSLVLAEVLYSQIPVRKTFSNLGFKRTAFRNQVPAFMVSGALLLCFPLLLFFMQAPLQLAPGWRLNLAGLSLTAGLMEEAFFRGFVFRHFRVKMSFRQAALWSMAFFAFTHLLLFTYLEWPIALVSTLLAIVSSWPLAYLFEKGQNTVWGPALLHTVIRMIGMVIVTDADHQMKLSMNWILTCMFVPYLVLIFRRDFRSTFLNAPSGMPKPE